MTKQYVSKVGTFAATYTTSDSGAPLLAGVADPRIPRTPRHWTDIDRHYQALRLRADDLHHVWRYWTMKAVARDRLR